MKTVQKKELGFTLQGFSKYALKKKNLKTIKGGGNGANYPALAGTLG